MPDPSQKSEFPIDVSLLLPRIRPADFNAGLSQAGVPAEQLPIMEPLVGKLLVGYAFDLPQGFMMARPQDLAQLGLERHQLRQIALENLKRRMADINVQFHGPTGEVRRVVTGNHFEACTLLATNFWKKVAEQTAGEVVASCPTRDIVLFCSSESKLGLEALGVVTREMMRLESENALSDELFVWRNGWQAFEKKA